MRIRFAPRAVFIQALIKILVLAMEFSKRLLTQAHVAVAPGVGFGEEGEGFVRIALVENEQRIRQAARNIKKFLAGTQSNGNVVPITAVK